MALSFDDGPSSANTGPLLELLARRGARLTFVVDEELAAVQELASVSALLAAPQAESRSYLSVGSVLLAVDASDPHCQLSNALSGADADGAETSRSNSGLCRGRRGVRRDARIRALDLGLDRQGITGHTNTMYVVAKTKERSSHVQRLHALDITTGAKKFGGPVVIQGSLRDSGAGLVGGQVPFDPLHENQRTGLLLLNGVVYFGFASTAMCSRTTNGVLATSATYKSSMVFPDRGAGARVHHPPGCERQGSASLGRRSLP